MFANVTIQTAGRHGSHRWVGLCLASLWLAGCGSSAYQSAPVDAPKARDTLVDVLESWKSGESIESLQDLKPPVVVQDFDWMGGAQLLAFEIVDEDKAVNANLITKVKLTLKDKLGATSDKTVTYVVGTSPTLTVFRDNFQ